MQTPCIITGLHLCCLLNTYIHTYTHKHTIHTDAIMHKVMCSAAKQTIIFMEQHKRQKQPPPSYFESLLYMSCDVETSLQRQATLMFVDDERYAVDQNFTFTNCSVPG